MTLPGEQDTLAKLNQLSTTPKELQTPWTPQGHGVAIAQGQPKLGTD